MSSATAVPLLALDGREVSYGAAAEAAGRPAASAGSESPAASAFSMLRNRHSLAMLGVSEAGGIRCR